MSHIFAAYRDSKNLFSKKEREKYSSWVDYQNAGPLKLKR